MTRGALGLALGLLLAGGTARAAPVCLDDLPVDLARDFPVPVGCEAVDCCPGCPLGEPIRLRVRLRGEGAAALVVRVPGAEAVRMPPGERLFETRARGGDAGPAPLLSLRVEPSAEALAQWRRDSAAAPGPLPLGTIAVEVEQLLGSQPVNHSSKIWDILGCTGVLPAPCDRIVQNGKAGTDASVILVDARRQAAGGDCVDDEVRRAAGNDSPGNLLSPAACASEVGVFASGNAMALRENVSAWTDACGDTLTVDLAPILQMPGTLFLAVPDVIAQAEWGAPVEDEAAADLKLANAIYDANKTGISFVMPAKKLGLVDGLGLLELIPKIVEALANGFDPVSFVCGLPASLESKGLYVEDQLNVYYLPVPGTGMMCPDDPNAIFVALNKNLETLAHEFGHSLSLLGDWGHTNTAPGFASNNLMWVRADGVRDHLSLGQAFRLNVADGSMLNVDGVRLGSTRPCPPALDSVACPPLALDWVRP